MAKYYCTLAKTYDPDKHDVQGWVWSEKLDGVRALWRPDEGRFVSRSDKTLNVPKSFHDMMTKIKIPLDGEFFMGRGRFQDTVSAVRKKAPTEEQFVGVKYIVFDAVMQQADFAERLLMAEGAVGRAKDSRIAVLTHRTVTSVTQAENEYFEIMRRGGEGLMFRHPGMPYEFKRSSNLLKMKGEIDGKAVVTDIEEGEGKHKGRMGALAVMDTETEVRFRVGTGFTDAEREQWWNQEQCGGTIRWRAMELTRDGVPRFPVFVCMDEGD